LEDVIAALEAYEDEFSASDVVPACIVLLNILTSMPARQRGMYGLNTWTVVARVTYRLLRSLRDPYAIEHAARQILPDVNTLSGRLEVIDDIGHRPSVGHRMVAEHAASELEVAWRADVRAALGDDLAREPRLLRVLLRTKRDALNDEPQLVVADVPAVTLALLRSARSEVISQSMGSRAIRRSPRLEWDILADLCGGQDVLARRVEELKASGIEAPADLLELASKYASGWRHQDD
jgi:hypothetical protein